MGEEGRGDEGQRTEDAGSAYRIPRMTSQTDSKATIDPATVQHTIDRLVERHGPQQAVDGADRAGVHVDGPGQLAPHLVEMAVDLLEHPLQTAEGGAELAGVGDEMPLTERSEILGAAILRPPAPGHLLHAPPDAVRLLGAVPLDEAVDNSLKGLRVDAW